MTTKELIKRTRMSMTALATLCDVPYEKLKNYSMGRTKTPEEVRKKLEKIAQSVRKL